MSGGARRLGVIGTMSGTSMDGVDVAWIETDGESVERLGATLSRPYTDAERAAIRAALDEGPRLASRADRPPATARAEAVVTTAHAEAIEAFLATEGLAPAQVDAVGFHGQTTFHDPARRLTVQIGDGPGLARRLGIPVVFDFRAADVAAGGEGAPLVPIFHLALARRAGLALPLAILNVGGVANVTLIDADGGLLAFDTGPGNALIDDLVRERAGLPMDEDGRIAARGRADEARLAALMAHPFFDRPPPKSLDRDEFRRHARAVLDGATLEDGAATLAAFTASAVARALEWTTGQAGGRAGRRGAGPAAGASRLVVAGGGASNPVLLAELARRTGLDVLSARAIGLSPDFLEAQAFGYLAARSLRGLPLSFPGTTRVPAPLTGGVVARP